MADCMASSGLGVLPVVERPVGRLRAIVTTLDLLAAQERNLQRSAIGNGYCACAACPGSFLGAP